MSASSGGEGLFASLKAMAATLVAMAKTRLELLSTEIAVEKERALRQLILAQLLVFFLGVAIVFAALALLFALESQRVLVAGLLAGFFVLAAAMAGRALARSQRRAAPPLADTLAELEEDLRQLKAAATGRAADPSRDQRHDQPEGS